MRCPAGPAHGRQEVPVHGSGHAAQHPLRRHAAGPLPADRIVVAADPAARHHHGRGRGLETAGRAPVKSFRPAPRCWPRAVRRARRSPGPRFSQAQWRGGGNGRTRARRLRLRAVWQGREPPGQVPCPTRHGSAGQCCRGRPGRSRRVRPTAPRETAGRPATASHARFSPAAKFTYAAAHSFASASSGRSNPADACQSARASSSLSRTPSRRCSGELTRKRPPKDQCAWPPTEASGS